MEFANIFYQPWTLLAHATLYRFQVYMQITATVEGSIRMYLKILKKYSNIFYLSKISNNYSSA